jgi:hypothetical protein
VDSQVIIKDAAALRHTLQIKKRLQLEFLASLSNLLREHNVAVNDSLLINLVLATPDELVGGAKFNDTTNVGAVQPGTGFTGSPEAELLKQMMGQNPSAPVYNVIMTRTSDPRVINLVLGLGPQPGGGDAGVGPQPGGGGVGPQPGGGTGPQPGGGTGPQPGGGTGPQPGGGTGPQPGGGTGPQPGGGVGPQP